MGIYEAPTYVNKYTNLIGELKPTKASDEDIAKDYFRIHLFSKVILDQGHVNSIISFQSVGENIDFYITQKVHPKIYIPIQLESISIPTPTSTIGKLVDYFDTMYNVCYLCLNHCFKNTTTTTSNQSPPPSLPLAVFKSLFKLQKKRKSTDSNENDDD